MILPRVLAYDAEGVPMAAQQVRDEDASKRKASAVAEVPFRQWLQSNMAKELDLEACYQGAIHTVLHTLHLAELSLAKALRVIYNTETKTAHVQAVADIKQWELRLPPCAPQTLRLQKSSQHPHRVAVMVTRKSGGFDGEAAQTYFIRVPGGEAPRTPSTLRYKS